MQHEKILLKGSIWSAFGFFYSLIGNYFIVYLLTKLFGFDYYGYYILVLSITTLFSTIALFGFDGVILYYYPKLSKEEVKILIRKTLLTICVLGGLLMTFLLLIGNLIAIKLFNNIGMLPFIKIMFTYIILDCIIMYCVAVLRSALKIKYKVFYEQIIALTLTIALLAILYVSNLNNYTLYIILLIKTILAIFGICFIYFIVIKDDKCCIPEIDDKKVMGVGMLKYAFVYCCSILVTSIYSGAAPWLLGGLLDIKMVGSFDLISRISQFVLMPMFIFDITFAPLISKLLSSKNYADAQRMFTISSKIISIISLIIFIILISFYKNIIIVFGKEFFNDGYTPLVILMYGKMFHSLTGSTGWILLVSGKSKYHLFNSIVFAISNLTLNILLIPSFGLMGATIAISTSLIINKILSTLQVRKHLKLSPFKGMGISFYLLTILLLVLTTLLSKVDTLNIFIRITIIASLVLLYSYFIVYTLQEKEKIIIKNLTSSIPCLYKLKWVKYV